MRYNKNYNGGKEKYYGYKKPGMNMIISFLNEYNLRGVHINANI